MAKKSLLPADNNSPDEAANDLSYLLSSKQPTIQPLPSDDSAAALVREKVARIYASEPNASQELAEAEAEPKRSKHQEFMHHLSNSGKDLATIQTEWHNYYLSLPDTEKHEVWQEFYASNTAAATFAEKGANLTPQQISEHKHEVVAAPKRHKEAVSRRKLRDARSRQEIQAALRDTITGGGKLQAKHHLQSLLFGLGMGAVVLIVVMFGLFNDFILAPFIQPGRVAAATPIIVNSSGVAPTSSPEVIVPKINAELPVNYTETSTNEATIENDLEDGVVHYPTTVLPGQKGNAAFFGHSSNNILNKGHYKFAFVLLHTIVPGDTFYLTYNSKVYVYKVISRTIVDPTDVSVLDSVPGQTATATLITCDPPGTSWHRLIVVGQQISPDPAANSAPAVAASSSVQSTAASLPGNGPTLFNKASHSSLGKIIGIAALIAVFIVTIRWVNEPKRLARTHR